MPPEPSRLDRPRPFNFPLRERTPSKSHTRPLQAVHFSSQSGIQSILGIYDQASARLENG